jgi:sugar phosphate isomerase/epimerase
MACSGLSSLPDDIPAGTAEAIRAAACETGVRLAAVSATYNMIHPDPAEREKGHRSLSVIARAASGAGIPLVTLCTGTRDPHDQWRWHRDNDTPDAWRDLVVSMRAAIEVAEEFGRDLGVEPEDANVVDSAERARSLIEELGSSRVKIVFDPANLVSVNVNEHRRIVARAIDILADRIVMAHAKDRDPRGRFVAAGRGVVDYRHYLGCLKSLGFSGPLVAHGLDAAEAPPVREWLGKLLAETGFA